MSFILSFVCTHTSIDDNARIVASSIADDLILSDGASWALLLPPLPLPLPLGGYVVVPPADKDP